MSRRLQLLSVDDEPHILQVRALVLEQAGYFVLSASNGAEALQVFAENNVDLVLLDYFMPDRDGASVATEMKSQKPNVPIIIVSASVDVQERTRWVAERFVAKGQGPEVLLDEIGKLLPDQLNQEAA